MTATLIVPRIPLQPDVHDDEPIPLPDLATARYVDREAAHARAIANLCTTVAPRARSEARHLVACTLRQLAGDLTDEAQSLTGVSHSDVRSPRRSSECAAADGGLAAGIDVISGSLQHSERTLRSLATHPDLSRGMAARFDALASTRRAQHNLLCACSAIDH
jgi:hypothetical protein